MKHQSEPTYGPAPRNRQVTPGDQRCCGRRACEAPHCGTETAGFDQSILEYNGDRWSPGCTHPVGHQTTEQTSNFHFCKLISSCKMQMSYLSLGKGGMGWLLLIIGSFPHSLPFSTSKMKANGGGPKWISSHPTSRHVQWKILAEYKVYIAILQSPAPWKQLSKPSSN